MNKADTPKNYVILKRCKYSNYRYSMTAVSKHHIESIRLWRNDQVEVLRQNGEITKQNQVEYYKTVVWPELLLSEPGRLLFSFFKGSEFIGYGGLVHIDWKKMSAEMSFILSTKRMKNVIQYQEDLENFISILKGLAFSELGFEKIVTETYSFRKLTIDILEKSDFIIDPTAERCKSDSNCESIFHCLMA